MLHEPEPEPSFEQALIQLEQIVASLERGEPELTTALANYEKGVRLLTLCYRLLDQAEQSVALLTGVDDQGNPLMSPFDATATTAREAGSAGTGGTNTFPNDLKQKPSERPSLQKSRPIPTDDPTDPCDPPF